MADGEKSWERETLEKLAFAALKEQTRARRWGIFFKLLTFAYLTFLLLMAFQWSGDAELMTDGKHTALVELDGVIDAKGEASAEKITGALQSAFKDKNTQGVILRINSPGGSPVQSGIINDEVRRLRGVYPNTPL
jgi:protease-4